MVEVLVVADVVTNETTELATHLAPCAGQLERADLTLATDQYLPAVVPPAEMRKELWWILAKLLEQLGHQAVPGERTADQCRAEDLMALALAPPGTDLETLMQAGNAVVAHEAVYGWVRRNVQKRGGWRLAPAELVALLQDMPDPEGLVLLPRRQLKHFNSQLVGTADLTAGQDEPQVLLNPGDALDAGLSHGDRVDRAAATDGVLRHLTSLSGRRQPKIGPDRGVRGATTVGAMTSLAAARDDASRSAEHSLPARVTT